MYAIKILELSAMKKETIKLMTRHRAQEKCELCHFYSPRNVSSVGVQTALYC